MSDDLIPDTPPVAGAEETRARISSKPRSARPRVTDDAGSSPFHHDRLHAIRQLLDMFRMERLVYLLVTLISVVVLLTCAIVLLWKRSATYVEIVGLFGSSGGITYSTGRLLRMWSDAIRILQPRMKGGDE